MYFAYHFQVVDFRLSCFPMEHKNVVQLRGDLLDCILIHVIYCIITRVEQPLEMTIMHW